MFSKKSVLTSKPINLTSFAEYHIDYLFDRMGWKVFLEINEKSYPNLVRTFYANLSLDQHNIIHSRVGSVDISLSVDDIALIIALPSEGLYLF